MTELQQSSEQPNPLNVSISPAVQSKPESDYTHYLDRSVSIEDRFQIAMDDLGISAEQQGAIRAFLAPLKQVHEPTYEHTIRVGLLARAIGSFLQLDQNALFRAGVLHDVGKAQVPLETLAKTSGWTDKDTKIMRRHVEDGFRLIRDKFDFTADVIKWHHTYQPNPYPGRMPADLHDYSEATKIKAQQFGRLVSIADTFDALHRINDHHGGEKKALTGEQVKEKMLQFNPDMKDVLELLFRMNVLTTYIAGEPHEETVILDQQDSLYESSFVHTNLEEREPSETRRAIQLAVAVEPTSDKAGCTTRFQDVSRHLKLEYFIVSAINIGDSFEGLAKFVERTGGIVGAYEYGAQAQLEGKRNRRGGRVNQGIIELLVPIVSAQYLHDLNYTCSTDEILQLASDVLSKTERADVDNLVRLKEIAYELSHMNDREVAKHPAAKTIAEYYSMEYELNSEKATSEAHNLEFILGFPTVKLMANVMQDSEYPHFSQKVDLAYQQARLVLGPEVASGFLADCIAVATYVCISQDPTLRLIG